MLSEKARARLVSITNGMEFYALEDGDAVSEDCFNSQRDGILLLCADPIMA